MVWVGKGYGKTILFGEHFVVYGLPGIAAGIDKYVEIKSEKVKDSDDVIIDDKVFKEKVSLKENPENIKFKLLEAMVKDEQFIKLKSLKFVINSNFSAGGGMGYSAALCVAFARVLNEIFDMGWKDEKINEVAYKGECVSHGSPSGIDNTCATYGTTIWFEKNLAGGKNTERPMKCGKSLLCLLVDSGIKHDTKQSVADVKKRKEENEKEYEKIFSEYKTLVGKAKKELQFGGLEELGKLMNQNNELLKKLGVSIPQIDEMIKIGIYSGALGAKITGAGVGGNILILCTNEAQREKLAQTYTSKGFNSIKIKIS